MKIPLLLTFVLGVAATKDALEDIRKHTADDVQNNRTTSTLQKDGKEELNAWKDAKYGKIFKLKNCELQAGSSGAKSKIQKNIEGSPVKLSPFTKIVCVHAASFLDGQCHSGLGRDGVKQLKR